MGLMFPEDLTAWQRWQRSRHSLRRVRDLVRRPTPPHLRLFVRGVEPVVLFALEATTPTAVASIAEPLTHLGDVPAAVLAPADVTDTLPGEWVPLDLEGTDVPPPVVKSVKVIVATGHFLAAGAAAYRWSSALDATFLVVQHGLLVPQAPPLPSGAHVLAFTDDDLTFWRSGRSDITGEPIGSQLLWNAAQADHAPVDPAAPPMFLGQLHGAELSRRISARTAQAFCTRTGALYRPHPAETDVLSRAQHARWRASGIQFTEAGPMLRAGRPVVSIFSTGVLEAAAAGVPSWVTCVRPPVWVREFWDRYTLSPWGGAPTEAPRRPEVEPARRIAQIVSARVEGR